MLDLRGSGSLLRLAQGQGTLADLEKLTGWADELNVRVQQIKAAPSPSELVAPPEPRPKPTGETRVRKPKKDTTPKAKPQPADVRFALAVAEEYGDSKVKGWAQEFADGKISEAQWQSRLTSHAAATRGSLDDVFERALQRVNKDGDAQQQG